MNLLHKKGQGIVEFGIVLMLAIPFVFVVYFVFIFGYYYTTVASLARESARELSVQTTSTMSTARDAIITRKANGNTLLGSYYVWNPIQGISQGTEDAFKYNFNSTNGDAYVTVTMTATKTQSGLNDIFSILPNTIKATSTMYWEGSTSSSQ